MRKQFLLLFGIFVVLEVYVYQGVKNLTQNPFIRGGYVAVNALIYATIFYLAVIRPDSSKVPFMMNIVMIFIVPKLVVVLFFWWMIFFGLGSIWFRLFLPKEATIQRGENSLV